MKHTSYTVERYEPVRVSNEGTYGVQETLVVIHDRILDIDEAIRLASSYPNARVGTVERPYLPGWAR